MGKIHDALQRAEQERTRAGGAASTAAAHLELDDDLNLLEAHRISDEVEAGLQESFPTAEIIIHIDPISVVANEPQPDFLKDE